MLVYVSAACFALFLLAVAVITHSAKARVLTGTLLLAGLVCLAAVFLENGWLAVLAAAVIFAACVLYVGVMAIDAYDIAAGRDRRLLPYKIVKKEPYGPTPSDVRS